MTIDHVIPVSKAPELAIDDANMRTCCVSCNSSKGSRNERVFLEDAFLFNPCDLEPYIETFKAKSEVSGLLEQLDIARTKHLEAEAEIRRIKSEIKKADKPKPKMCRFTLEAELPHHCCMTDTKEGKGCKIPIEM
jgi:hypothetical protein